MQRISWIPKAAALAVLMLAAFALAASTPAPLVVTNTPSLSAAGPFAACDGSGLTTDAFTMPDSSAVSQPDGSNAACRRAPECWTDSDCDVQCGGVGLGKCVHSNCPVRICKCR